MRKIYAYCHKPLCICGLCAFDKLFCSDDEVGVEAFAGGAEAGNVEDAVFGGGFLQREREEIGTEEVLPEVVVGGRVGQVDIRPDDEAFAFWVGGALDVLEKLEAENNGRLDLGIEGIEEADVGGDGGVAAGGGCWCDGGYGEDVNASGAETGAGGGIVE